LAGKGVIGGAAELDVSGCAFITETLASEQPT
jgi:hypothetical protein